MNRPQVLLQPGHGRLRAVRLRRLRGQREQFRQPAAVLRVSDRNTILIWQFHYVAQNGMPILLDLQLPMPNLNYQIISKTTKGSPCTVDVIQNSNIAETCLSQQDLRP